MKLRELPNWAPSTTASNLKYGSEARSSCPEER
jgi:hypothetical protein